MSNSEKALRAIRAAKKESQVVTAVRDYLDSLDPVDAALLPTELLAMGLNQAEEVIQAALQSVHARMKTLGETPEAALLSETVLVFTTAARRLATLAKDPA